MTDQPKYDPDRMTFEDLDLSDLDAVNEWMEHPVTRALHDDLARSFQQKPEDVKRVAYSAEVARLLADRTNALKLMDSPEVTPEMRAGLEAMVISADGYIGQLRQKLRDLDGQ